MKNFTKQNFKTNPLWIRLLITTFMLLAGAGIALADGSAAGPKGVYLNVNGTNTWYNVYSTSWDYSPSCSGWNTFKSATSISGKDLGTVTTLQLKGYAVIGWTNNSDWVAGELRYQINSGNYTYFKVGNWDSGSSAANVVCSNGNDRAVGINNQSVNLLSGLNPGKHTIKFMPAGKMRYNGGDFNYVSHSELSATFTVPGYSTTTGTLAIGSVNIGDNNSETQTMTHYGSTATATAEVTGTNASEFKVTSVSATSVTVKFTPTSAGSKTATVTVTDAYGKTYTLTVTGTGTCTVKKSETGGEGTVIVGPTTLTTSGSSMTSGTYDLSITAPAGYKVSAVSVSGGSLTTAGTTGSTTYTGKVNVSANTTINVTYAIMTYTVKKSETGGEGTVKLGGTTITTGGVSISYGSKALSITAPTGYNVSSVTVSGGTLTAGTTGSSTYSGTVNVTAATTITIEYVAKTFTVKKSETGGEGTVKLGGTTITTGGVSISYGSKALSITAPTGYNVSSVTVSAGTLTPGTTGSSTYSGTVNVTAATTISVTYEQNCITVETPDIDPVAICAGSTVTLTLNNKQDGVTYTLDDTPIFTDDDEYTTPILNTNTTYTITATSANSCVADQEETATVTVTVNAMPSLSPSATVTSICEGETKTLRVNTNATSIKWYKNGTLIGGQTTASLSISSAGTYKVVVSNASGCSKEMSFTVANAFGSDITPTITGSASVQSGAANITYSTANVDGATYVWQLPTGWTFSGDEDGNQITVSVPSTEGNGTITVNITKNDCTKTATLDVAWMDGFTVYLRRPHAKDETTQYNYWFEKSNAAGPGYIKFGTVKETPTAAELYEYNGGSGAETAGVLGTKGTESFTDCDGYVWDAYNIGIDVTALYFHAPNDKSTNGTTYGGYATYTRSYSQNDPISSDLYFTMGNWVYPQKGRELTKVEKPFEGIEIDALGSTEICSNNMASFAALYLKSNCTGQEITAYAWKFSTDNSNWGPYTTGKGANTNNIRPNKAGYYHLECTLKDGSVVTSNSIEIETTTCSISNADLNNITSNLPIIMVNTGDKAFPSVDNGKHCSASADDLKKKRSVDVKILWNQAENGTVSSTDAYSNGANLYYDRKARMNYRGSSSLNFEKKSFAFCPGDENCGQDDDKSADYVKTKKMNMFGIGEAEDKDWVLYAAYVDPSMMRNILAMETYSAMTGKWGVKNQYVELYIDGEYQGVYVFMDKVTQNKKRVNVKWDVKDDTKREFILKFDKTDVEDRYEDASGDQKTFESDMTGKTGISTYDTEVDQRFEIEYPEKEDIMDDGGYWSDVYSFVLGKVNEFESALSKGDFTTVRSLINYESWADFFIINEFTKNVDAYRASCIFVYTGGKFEAWPLWDYELSFNNTVTGSGKGRGETTGLLIEHSDVYSDEFPAPFWWTGKYNGSNMYSGLLKDPCFVQMIKTRWAEHTKAGGPLNPTTTTAKTDAYKTILDAKGAATREFTKWPVASRGKDACNNVNTGYFANGGGGANTTYANSYSQLNTWLGTTARIAGLQAEIDKLDDIIEFGITSTVDKDETTPWRAVNVTVDAVGADYTYTVTPEIIEGQVIQGSDNLLIYAEPATLPQTYTVVTTLNAKDQCGGNDADNASSTVTFTVNDLVDNCEE